jgi:hypothetical protein
MRPVPIFDTFRPSMVTLSEGDETDSSVSAAAPMLVMSKKAAVLTELADRKIRPLPTLILAGGSPAAPVAV